MGRRLHADEGRPRRRCRPCNRDPLILSGTAPAKTPLQWWE
ncbi:hypothetical protein HMPREF9440_01715 [Sutterella parvirubra YIT 11816]|uniref:Uncharacterized protein n=1 Tax=Sutterella parvirubra YIT 11816 TaxID=762967 RepID=H3KG40_9BURK|nr:hypothetical protein HMPREF9440_01715 [Sutterella parvirubra YIT 11816]